MGGLTTYAKDTPAKQPTFKAWIQKIKQIAHTKGISKDTTEKAFDKLHKPLEKVIKLDRNQPEIRLTFDEYFDARVPCLVKKGKKMLKKYPTLLGKIEKKYGIPRAVIVALWGRETNYGGFTGKTPTIHALATLAWDGRRAKFFTEELLHALKILDEKHIMPHRMVGSWAGALGQCQFMPSSFHRDAVDETGKGRKDIWHHLPDVFGSTANYLKKAGWKSDEPCVIEVCLPEKLKTPKMDPKGTKTLSEWKTLGITCLDKSSLPTRNLKAALIIPEKSARAFLVFENIHAILSWNRSLNFALSVGLLANAIHDGDIEHV